MVKQTKSNFIRTTVFLGTMVLIAACGDSTIRTTQEGSLPESTGQSIPKSAQRYDTVNLSQQLEFSKTDLSRRLGVEVGTIFETGVRKVNWRSGALGCPSPGKSYTEALVPGILILLQANGEIYGYHAKVDGTPFFCPRERVEKPASIQDEDLA